jgi:tripartite-type tricarboxylate transporter receptor subunit TctC
VAEQLAAEVRKVLENPAVKEQVLAQGIEPVADSPAQFARFVKDESEKVEEGLQGREHHVRVTG